MGRSFRDLVASGQAWLPTPGQVAGVISDWDPRTDDLSELDVPMCPDWEFFAWTTTPDKSSSIELRDYAAENFQRMYGFIGLIDSFRKFFLPGPFYPVTKFASHHEECKPSPNTDTNFRFEVVTKIPYYPLGHTPNLPTSHLWVKIRAYAASAMLPRGESFALGDFVSGIPVANYGSTGRANLDAWTKADLTAWDLTMPETKPSPADFDFREWVMEWLPTLGGRGFATDSPDDNRLNGVRLLPTKQDPHVYVRGRREETREADAAAAATGNAPREPRVLFRPSSYRRPRGRSTSRKPKSP